jgi:hypothetical protein
LDRENYFRLAVFWAGIGTFTSLLAIPYELDLFSAKLPSKHLPLPILFSLQAVQAFVLLLFAVWAGLSLGSKVGLDSPFARALVYGLPRPPWSPKRLGVAAALGAVVGVAVRAGLGGTPRVAAWKGLLVSFYGGITEELFLRLFAMSVLAWIAWRLFERARPAPSALVYWAANAMAALLFGVGHLPVAASIWPLTPLVVARVVILNAAAGVVFGAIFWRWGIEHAMISHFLADIVLHVIFAD